MTETRRTDPVVLAILAMIAAFAALSWYFGGGDFLAMLQAMRDTLTQAIETSPVAFRIGYTLATCAIIGAYIPAAPPLLLIAGALFGFWEAMLWFSIGNTAGCAAGFLLSRHYFRPRIQRRYADKLKPVNESFERHGAWYIAMLRLLPVMPAEMVNLFAGLLPVRLWTFCWITLVTRLPLNAVYINLGDEVWDITSVHDLLSASFIASMFALCLLVLAGHVILHRVTKTRLRGN